VAHDYARLVSRSFAVRGIVEGFYGLPWSHDARLDAITFLAPRGLNAYVYAPKDDAKHRAAWREPYDAEELARFHELATHAAERGVQFGFAISPGLDMAYRAEHERAALYEKLRPLVDAGVPWFLLLVDDISMRPGLAAEHGELATWLWERLRAARADVAMALCPTEYVGTRPSPYLEVLGAGLPADIDVMWTGPTVCSPAINADDARAWAQALGDHRVLVWDNYPVNDASMANSLHLGPYRGRDAKLVDVVGGVLCNPMTQPRASLIALSTAMEFLSAPDEYDEAAAWQRAIDDVGGERAQPLAVLARACADSPVTAPAELGLAALVDELEEEVDGPGRISTLDRIASELRAARMLPDAFPAAGDALAEELAPWAAAARRQAEAGLAALRLIQRARPVAHIDDAGKGRVAAVDAENAMQTAFVVLFGWQAARADEKVVYGPRFATYASVVQLPDGRPALDVSLALREDANAIDRLCRLALDVYDGWQSEADAPVKVYVDGERRETSDDGSFAGHGRVALVRCGSAVTRIRPGQQLPFRDSRFA
jgi:hyaluronoglucosaminidase